MENSKKKSLLYKAFHFDENEDENMFFLDALDEDKKLRKAISKKIMTEEPLTNKEYMKLLEYALEEYKTIFTLDSFDKKYEIIFRESNDIDKGTKEDKER